MKSPPSLGISDPSGYRWPPTFPAGSKQLSSNFDNLLFLEVFRVLNFWSRFEALNDVFWGMLWSQNFINCCSPRIDLSNGLS
jgi:hypothetical protein